MIVASGGGVPCGALSLAHLARGMSDAAIFRDSFSGESDGTTLPNHTNKIDYNPLSNSWTDITAGITIESDKASSNQLTSCSAIEMGRSDIVMEVDVVPQAGGNGFHGLLFRRQDATHFLIAGLDITWDKVTIWENNGGVWAERSGNANGSFNVVAGTTYKLKLVLKGSSIKLLVDGVSQATATLTIFQTETTHGIYADAAAGGADATWDDLIVNPN